MFEKSSSNSFLTDSPTGSSEKSHKTPVFQMKEACQPCTPQASKVINPLEIDIEPYSDEVPQIKADFIDRKMSQMTEIQGRLEHL